VRKAERIVVRAAERATMPDWDVVKVEAQTMESLDRELSGPDPMVGAAEVGEILGVSRQRLHQLRGSGRSPEPASDLAAGPVWLRKVIETTPTAGTSVRVVGRRAGRYGRA
jgi:hypothetical protein